MTYAWTLWDNLHAITTHNTSINVLTEGYIAEHLSIFPRDAYRMNFTDNHDKNSWEGNQYSNFGDGFYASMVLCATMDGMPLIDSGPEAGLNRSLKFFDHEPIDWKQDDNAEIYKKLFQLKRNNQALWNGQWGGEMTRIKNNRMYHVIAFSREKNNDKVITVVNLSNMPVTVKLDSKYEKGDYTELFTGKKIVLKGEDEVALNPWDYIVLVK